MLVTLPPLRCYTITPLSAVKSAITLLEAVDADDAATLPLMFIAYYCYYCRLRHIRCSSSSIVLDTPPRVVAAD